MFDFWLIIIKYMSKGQRIIMWIMCVVSFVLSVAAVCMAYYHTPDLGFDYQGVIVGVLSLLVTALIGWQIFSIITLKTEIEKCTNEIVNEKLKLLNYSITGYTKARLSNTLFYKGDTNSLDNAFDALEDVVKSGGIDIENTALNCTIQRIVDYIDDIKSSNDGKLYIMPGKKNHYLTIMKKIEHEDKDCIIMSLKNSAEGPQSA